MPGRKFQTTVSSLLPILVLLGASLFDPQSGQPPQTAKPKKEQKPPRISSHIVLITISGLRADAVNNPNLARMPAIQSLREKGVHAVGLESVFPTQTNPAHASLITGTLPADHGITSDFPFNEQTATQAADPYRLAREIKTEAIWEYVRREGFTVAAAGFPLTVGANIKFNVHPATPEESQSAVQLRGELLSALKTETTVGEKSKSVIQPADLFNTEAVVYLIGKHRPNLTMINFTSLELAQQRYGISAKETAATLEGIDRLVEKIVGAVHQTGQAADTSFFILSDYGAAKVEHEFRPNVLLARKGWLTPNGKGEITSWRAVAQTFGGSAAIFVRNPQDETFVRELEALFNEHHKKPDSAIWRVLPHLDAARLGADPRPALFLDAAPTYTMSDSFGGSSTSDANSRAAHGYSPSRSEMRAALILSGRGIKSGGRIEYARLIDIAPTIARLLGLEMKTARGRVLTEAIAP